MTKKGLLVGINRYQVPGADLRGCLNDVQDVRDVLVDVCGFPPSGLTALTDLDATKAAIQRSLEELVTTARPGDVVFMLYAGHGSSVSDTSGDETDLRDEILCPTDLDWQDPLLDDWLRALFDRVAEGVNLTVVMDCCHSGSNTRALRPPDSREPVERFLPCPIDLQPIDEGRSLRDALRRPRHTLVATGPGTDVRELPLSEILITACRDDQTAADAYIDGGFHGALTHSLVRVLRGAGDRLTYRDLHQEAVQLMRDQYDQVPQLEGRASSFDRPFLTPFA
jgi:hypothetical protein